MNRHIGPFNYLRIFMNVIVISYISVTSPVVSPGPPGQRGGGGDSPELIFPGILNVPETYSSSFKRRTKVQLSLCSLNIIYYFLTYFRSTWNFKEFICLHVRKVVNTGSDCQLRKCITKSSVIILLSFCEPMSMSTYLLIYSQYKGTHTILVERYSSSVSLSMSGSYVQVVLLFITSQSTRLKIHLVDDNSSTTMYCVRIKGKIRQ